ncbi:MAG: hypothetical protein ACREV5_11355 [Steroidobacter sp.]
MLFRIVCSDRKNTTKVLIRSCALWARLALLLTVGAILEACTSMPAACDVPRELDKRWKITEVNPGNEYGSSPASGDSVTFSCRRQGDRRLYRLEFQRGERKRFAGFSKLDFIYVNEGRQRQSAIVGGQYLDHIHDVLEGDYSYLIASGLLRKKIFRTPVQAIFIPETIDAQPHFDIVLCNVREMPCRAETKQGGVIHGKE